MDRSFLRLCVQARLDASSAAVTRAPIVLDACDSSFTASDSKALASKRIAFILGQKVAKMRAALALLPVVGAYVSPTPKRAVLQAVSNFMA